MARSIADRENLLLQTLRRVMPVIEKEWLDTNPIPPGKMLETSFVTYRHEFPEGPVVFTLSLQLAGEMPEILAWTLVEIMPDRSYIGECHAIHNEESDERVLAVLRSVFKVRQL